MVGYLDDYVKLVVRIGLNVQKNQKVVIRSPIECADFTRRVAKECYAAGAYDVYVRWEDEQIGRIRYLNAPEPVFDEFPEWTRMMLDSLSEEGAAFLSVSAADPEALLGVDQDRIMRQQIITKKKLENYYKRSMANEIQWCVASIPTEKWAKKVFPEAKDGAEAIELLWQAIFKASRVDGNDVVENWVKHTENLNKCAKILNDYNFKTLKYKNSSGTDIEVGLPEGHIWLCAGEKSKNGIDFMCNIPTEEVFTAPDRNAVNGRVVSSKPLVYNGNLIEDFTVDFKDGKVVGISAKKNADLLDKLVHSTPNADYLGEVALVPFNSPISNTNTLFYNTLYDENASCHFAFGKAYPSCAKGTDGKTDEQLLEMGLNVSLEHSDYMIGTSDLEITGVTHDGKEIKVFVNGNFAF